MSFNSVTIIPTGAVVDATTTTPRYAVTRISGQPIPDGEPCFVIRAQDAFAVRAVQAYIDRHWLGQYGY
jgi:hypothetical protein